MKAVLVFLLGAALSANIATASSQNTVVETVSGKLLGTIDESRLGNKFYSFKGIPYAKSPKRFQVTN